MKDMVVGFMYSDHLDYVLLMKKNRPQWQSGLLNGVGGKIEPGESPVDAMAREFREETGLETSPDCWDHCVQYKIPDEKTYFKFYTVHFFALLSGMSPLEMKNISAQEDEELIVVEVDSIGHYATIPNLAWIVSFLVDVEIDWIDGPIKLTSVI